MWFIYKKISQTVTSIQQIAGPRMLLSNLLCPPKPAIRYDVQPELASLPTDTAIQFLIKACGHVLWKRGSSVSSSVRQMDYSA
jgi:hypothetical protein